MAEPEPAPWAWMPLAPLTAAGLPTLYAVYSAVLVTRWQRLAPLVRRAVAWRCAAGAALALCMNFAFLLLPICALPLVYVALHAAALCSIMLMWSAAAAAVASGGHAGALARADDEADLQPERAEPSSWRLGACSGNGGSFAGLTVYTLGLAAINEFALRSAHPGLWHDWQPMTAAPEALRAAAPLVTFSIFLLPTAIAVRELLAHFCSCCRTRHDCSGNMSLLVATFFAEIGIFVVVTTYAIANFGTIEIAVLAGFRVDVICTTAFFALECQYIPTSKKVS